MVRLEVPMKARADDGIKMKESGRSGVFGATGGRGKRDPEAGSPGAYFGQRGAAVRVLPHGQGHVVAVIGVGYVGLPTAATLAHLGHRVTCGDADPDKVAMLDQGNVPIVEDQLEALVREGQSAGRLRFVVGASAAVQGADSVSYTHLTLPTKR